MSMNEDNIVPVDEKKLVPGLSNKGTLRAVTLIGKSKNNLEASVNDLVKSISDSDSSSFWVSLDAGKIRSPYDWCSQFARNLRTKDGVQLRDLANFALSTGKSLSPFKSSDDSDDPAESKNIAGTLLGNFENLLEAQVKPKSSPHLVILIKNLPDFEEEIIDWMSRVLNPVIRDSKAFKNARFVFTADEVTEKERKFFNSFGFEKMNLVTLGRGDPKREDDLLPQSELDFNKNSKREEPQDKIKETPLKQKQKNTLPSKAIAVDCFAGTMDIHEAEKVLASFSEEEKSYLFLASYPLRISRYTLEFFETARNAALSYNWLNRNQSLYFKHESGDLLLNEDIRVAARIVHSNNLPDISENWSILSSVLDSFHELFPTDSTHWIPVNLQLLESFNKRILKSLFTQEQVDDILHFIDQLPNQFSEIDKKFTLSENAKLVTRRFLELTSIEPIAGFQDRIRSLWIKDNEQYHSQKTKMLREKDDVSAEIETTLGQVAQIKEMRDNLLENFRDPKRNKAERVYSFTTSRLLLVIGLATVGASLLSESIGSYHAACGLALTLFGFFWPNVETKRPAFATEGPRSNLAIETQQRSLNHRVGSLSNRIQVMKGNLDAVEKQLAKLGDAPPPPYLDSEQSEG
jgi:hypothetical protein